MSESQHQLFKANQCLNCELIGERRISNIIISNYLAIELSKLLRQ